MRTTLLLFFGLITTFNLFAQEDIPYAEKAAQLQKEIWGTHVPEFSSTTVPTNLNNESAVVLARSFNLQRTSHTRIKFMATTALRTMKLTTFHERVKINDKAALADFSTIEYQKKMDKTTSYLVIKFIDVKNVYVGAKIIKPNGKEIIVNITEAVLLKNDNKDQKGKLAIPDLQVGDILDYYISAVDMSENLESNSYKNNDNLFILADQYHVLYYSLDFQFNKKINVQYIYANGAPHFEESHDDAGDLVLSLKIRNMPKYKTELWTSPLRQYQYIEIGSTFRSTGLMLTGVDYQMNPKFSMFTNQKNAFEHSFMKFYGYNLLESKVKDYFKSHKALKNAPLDSVMKVLYDEWKFDVFCNYTGKELENIDEMNYRKANTLRAALISFVLSEMDIDHDVLLVASRNSNSLENVYNSDDMEALIRINASSPLYMCFDDVVTHFNEIPARLQGEKVIVLHPKTHYAGDTFTESEDTLPVASSDKNLLEELLQVNLVPVNMQKLKITRLVKKQGDLRHNDQKLLIPVEDIDNGYKNMINGEELSKRLKKSQATKKMTEDYIYSFTKEKAEMNKNFITEIKNTFGQDPEQVQDCKIIDIALENTNPAFQYSSSFVLNNLVKKAGNNYIIDVGKLTGDFYSLEDRARKRDIDVYMPCARSFKYIIAITIPQGYSAKGAEAFATKKTNKTGSFSTSAAITGNVLTIHVNRVYNNNFEKATDWPLMVDLIDDASGFNSQKILLEKTN
jgi:hypothetical protein